MFLFVNKRFFIYVRYPLIFRFAARVVLDEMIEDEYILIPIGGWCGGRILSRDSWILSVNLKAVAGFSPIPDYRRDAGVSSLDNDLRLGKFEKHTEIRNSEY